MFDKDHTYGAVDATQTTLRYAELESFLPAESLPAHFHPMCIYVCQSAKRAHMHVNLVETKTERAIHSLRCAKHLST